VWVYLDDIVGRYDCQARMQGHVVRSVVRMTLPVSPWQVGLMDTLCLMVYAHRLLRDLEIPVSRAQVLQHLMSGYILSSSSVVVCTLIASRKSESRLPPHHEDIVTKLRMRPCIAFQQVLPLTAPSPSPFAC